MKIIATKNAPVAIGPYSQAVKIDNFLYLSGQIAIDPITNEFGGGDIKTQTLKVINNIRAILESEGLTLENVFKTTCFLTNMADFADFNQTYGEYFSHKPARSTVEVSALPKGAIVEIEVVARV